MRRADSWNWPTSSRRAIRWRSFIDSASARVGRFLVLWPEIDVTEVEQRFSLNSADSLKLGISNAFVIDEAQLEPKMRTQSRLQKISTAISLFAMATSFSVLGFLIVLNQHDGGASIPGGIFGILLGATFLIAACLHLKRFQSGFQLEEVPADELVSEMPQAA